MPQVSVGGSVGPVRVAQPVHGGGSAVFAVVILGGTIALFFAVGALALLLLGLLLVADQVATYWQYRRRSRDYPWRQRIVATRGCPVCHAPPGWWCVGERWNHLPRKPLGPTVPARRYTIHAVRQFERVSH